MIDTHCHLTDTRLGDQLEVIMKNAKDAGVHGFITIGTDPDDDAAAIELAQRFANVWCAVGVHPNYCGELMGDVTDGTDGDSLHRIEAMLSNPRVVAVGECGLDYHYDRSPKNLQRRVFMKQLELAVRFGKPVVIHCREAVDDTLAILADFPKVRCDFHCFTGTIEEARRITQRGYMLGFTGPVTFKKNDSLRQACIGTPQDQLLIETDAPYLSPEPVRNERVNQPAFVLHVARAVALARGISLEALGELTTRNAERFFGIQVERAAKT